MDADSWYDALTLSERASLLRTGGQMGHLSAGEEDLANKRFEAWRSQSPFDKDAIFSRRCAVEKISTEEFRYLLAGSPRSLARRSEPFEWVRDVVHAFSASSGGEPMAPAAAVAKVPHVSFLEFAAPLIHHSRGELRRNVEEILGGDGDVPGDVDSLSSLFDDRLQVCLLQTLSPTLVLELNVARVMETLVGDTPEERFGSFLRAVCQPAERARILREYPVLARQLVLQARLWVESVTELVRHLAEDWPDILATFEPARPPGRLTQASGGLGDAHRGARSVAVLRFESGFRLVYKPRSLRMDEHFQELLGWINARGGPDLRTPKVLGRKHHGWVEWIENEACLNRAELERFYRRQGALIALCYVLEATDLHLENVIAAGEHPVMIDLESIFHQRYDRNEGDPLQEKATEFLRHSVLRSGLLPTRIRTDAEQPKGVDLSGLGGRGGQLVPGVFSWKGSGTDQMRLRRESVPMQDARNLPRIGDDVADPTQHVEAIVEGFTALYELLLRHRRELLSEGSVLDLFADDENRFIFRSTRSYYLLLQHSRHPDYQQNGLHRDRLFDHLWENVDSEAKVADVIMAERRDLERGDIPFFTTRPGSRDLWSSAGRRFPGFFEKSSLETIRSRIESLDRRALVPVRRRLLENDSSMEGIGAFTGWGSWIYVLTHLSVLWGEDALLAEADAALEKLGSLISTEENPDVVAGLAGCLAALTARYEHRRDDAVAAVASACGERLLAIARRPSELELRWLQPTAYGARTLSGFSHGAAGIAWALARWFRSSGDHRFRTAALPAIRYERRLFSHEHGTWPNALAIERLARNGDESLYRPHDSWCHGAAGIGLSRLRLLDVLDDEMVAEDVRRALAFTLTNNPDSMHVLCHGSLGNLDLLIEASRSFDPSLRSKVRRFSTLVLEDVRENGWRCGSEIAVETPWFSGPVAWISGQDLGALDRFISSRPPSRLALVQFDLVEQRETYGVDLFAALRYLVMESRKLVLLAASPVMPVARAAEDLLCRC